MDERSIYARLIQLGLKPKLIGFRYIIQLLIYKQNHPMEYCQNEYEKACKEPYHNVEGAIRYAINDGFKRCKNKAMFLEYFGEDSALSNRMNHLYFKMKDF